MQYIRLDYVFSYWIFFWYLMYVIGAVSISPKLVLCFAMLFNAISFSTLIHRRVKTYKIIKFFAMNAIIKYLPLFSLLHDRITLDQFIATALFFVAYLIYVRVGNGSIYDTYKSLYGQHDGTATHKTPTSIFYDYMFMM